MLGSEYLLTPCADHCFRIFHSAHVQHKLKCNCICTPRWTASACSISRHKPFWNAWIWLRRKRKRKKERNYDILLYGSDRLAISLWHAVVVWLCLVEWRKMDAWTQRCTDWKSLSDFEQGVYSLGTTDSCFHIASLHVSSMYNFIIITQFSAVLI